MREFWVASGHQLTRLDRAGRMQVTDELLLAWLARPEIMPPAEACATERAVHARLMAEPRASVPALQLAAMADADARENWGLLLRLREILLEEGTIEAGYARIVHENIRMPIVFMNQLVQLILRNALEGCQDVQVIRAAELMFRSQRGHVKDDSLMLADEELVEALEAEMHASPLTAMFSGGLDNLDILGGGNEWTYWSRSDAHTMVFNFGGDPEARNGLARAMEAFIHHMTGHRVTITPQVRADEVDLRWFVGLDQTGTAIGNALWKGEEPRDTMVGLFRLDFADPAVMLPDIAGHPVWLILGLGDDMAVRLKPQNLLTGLPLAPPSGLH